MSAYGDILTAVRDVIGALGLVANDSVRRRKRPVVLPEVETPPLVLVCPQQETASELAFNNIATFDYGVLVAVVQKQTDILEADLDLLLNLREGIRRALYKPLAAVGTTWDAEIDLSPAFDPAGLDPHYDFSLIAATFRNQESRSA